jgi:hypothetical protein
MPEKIFSVYLFNQLYGKNGVLKDLYVNKYGKLLFTEPFLCILGGKGAF